jgi:hypothetical protein
MTQVSGSSGRRTPLRTHVLNNIELILSAAGVLVVLVVPPLITGGVDDLWRVTAVVALVVGVLHGCIFWAIRRRQRYVRQQAFTEMRAMLQDVVRNHLAVIRLYSTMPDKGARATAKIDASVQEITHALDHLSEESLARWLCRYRDALSSTAPPGER